MSKIGQKVKCVKPGRGGWTPSHEIIDAQVGRIYTIRASYNCPVMNEPAVLVNEIKNRIHPLHGIEYGFFADRFVPIEERKTDISIFQKMLLPKKKKARA